MKPRKIVLLAACAILLCTFIVQTVMKNGDKVRNFDLSQTPDEISFVTSEGSYTLVQSGSEWTINEKDYAINSNVVESLIEAASSVKALDRLGKLSNETLSIRYELNAEKASVVTLKKDGKVLRTLTIGKTSSTGSQTYACIDDDKDVYLVAGNLHSDILKSLNDLRSKQIYSFDKEDITSISVTTYPLPVSGETEEKSFTVSRIGSGENAMWTISEPNVQVNAETAASWFGSVATLTTTKWYEANEIPANGVHAMTVKLSAGNKNITLEIYNTYTDEGKNSTSYATTSLNPYTFLITGSNVNKFNKTVEYFAQ